MLFPYWLPLAQPYDAPSYDPTLEAGIFLWKTKAGTWRLRATAGGGSSQYAGSIVSDLPAITIEPFWLEANDVLDTSDPTHITFDLRMWQGFQDGFDFEFPPKAKVYLDLETPEGAADLIHVGKTRWPVSQLPLELSGW